MICGRSAFIRVMNAFGTRGLILPIATPPVLEVEDGVDAAAVPPRLDGLSGQEHGGVDALDGAREDVPAEVRLVLVDADAPAPAFTRRVESTEATAPGDLEDDLRALRDLVQRDLLALGLVGEGLRERDQDVRPGHALARAGAVGRDEDADRRGMFRPPTAEIVLFPARRAIRRETPDHVAVLVRREGEAADVARRRDALRRVGERRILHRVVDDREARGRELPRDGVRRVGEQEAHRDRDVVTLARERREVRDVVARRP